MLPSVRHRKSPRASSVLHHMGHQPQVSFHQNISRLQVSLGGQGQIMLFLRQRLREAPGVELERIKQAAKQLDHLILQILYSVREMILTKPHNDIVILRTVTFQQICKIYIGSSDGIIISNFMGKQT